MNRSKFTIKPAGDAGLFDLVNETGWTLAQDCTLSEAVRLKKMLTETEERKEWNLQWETLMAELDMLLSERYHGTKESARDMITRVKARLDGLAETLQDNQQANEHKTMAWRNIPNS